MDIEASDSNALCPSPFQLLPTHPIHIATSQKPILSHSFASSPLPAACHSTLILTSDRLLLSLASQSSNQPFSQALLSFDLKFQVLHQTQDNIKSPKIGFRLYMSEEDGSSFYGHPSVVDTWVHHLSRLLHQKGFHERFKPLRKLGKGNFATVYEVERIEDGKKYAVKAFSKNTCFSTPKGKEGLINELEIMRTLSKEPHQNILKLVAVFESDNSIYVVLQLLTGGQLFSRLQERNGIFTSSEVQQCMFSLVSGLMHMHKNRIMHRDLKPENIMLRDLDSIDPVIGDFGLASNVDQAKYLYYRCGTPGYVAPEIVSLTQNGHVEPECDMFSLGVIFHILLVKKALFEGTKYDEVYRKNKQMKFDLSGERYKNVDPKAMDLLIKMLAADPKQRISAKLALSHPYFESVEPKGVSSPAPTLTTLTSQRVK